MAAAGWLALTVPLALLLVSVFVSPATNATVRAALAGFCLLAIMRPADALLVTFALVGFGIILSHLAGVPSLRVTEVFVVASLAGCSVHAVLARGAVLRREVNRFATVPVVVFACAAVASTLVWLRVYQFETGGGTEYVRAFIQFLLRDYFVQPGEFGVVLSTAVIVEGLALYVVAAALCHVDPTFFARALRMLALGGAGLAVMSAVRLAEIVLRNPQAIAVLRATSSGLRISPQIPDYIAAGSYFALCWLVALGIALGAPGRRLVWGVAAVALMSGLYLTGSRSVIAAALGGVAVLVLSVVRRKLVPVRGVVALAVVAAVVMVIGFRWMVGHDIAGETARQSAIVRVELIRAGLQVIATRPWFGVGIDRFFHVAGRFASPELRALWPGRMNPHNDFLRFGGELGLVGLALFLWILVAAGTRIWKALHRSADPRFAGLVGGLVAFLITSLASNPLMVREVSYVFWIALGLGVGYSATDGDVAEGPLPEPRWSTRLASWRWPIVVMLGAVLLASIPVRARQELATRDLTAAGDGLFDWSVEPDGTRCRLSGPRATLYVNGQTQLLEIPLKGTLPSGSLQQVEIRVDGRTVNRVAVGAEWQRLRTRIPAASSSSPRRIDLLVSPSWVPAEAIPGSQDRRTLGVKIGELNVLTIASPGR